MTLKDDVKGMFNDRKLGLQEEKRQVDGKIQSLSYRISVDLNSEAKSEVESLAREFDNTEAEEYNLIRWGIQRRDEDYTNGAKLGTRGVGRDRD